MDRGVRRALALFFRIARGHFLTFAKILELTVPIELANDIRILTPVWLDLNK